MEDTEVVKMYQDVYVSSLFPVCNNKDICMGNGSHNW